MLKPRIRMSGGLYFCSTPKGFIGYGSTVKTAYWDWVRLNEIVWKIKPVKDSVFGIPLKF